MGPVEGRPRRAYLQPSCPSHACWPPIDPSGSCSGRESRDLKETKKGVMLQGLAQVFCLVLVVSPHLGEALTCYSCGPHSDQGSCSDFSPDEASFKHSCPAEYRSCLLARGSFEGVIVISRECGLGRAPEGPGGCRTRHLGGGAVVSICSCQGNLCNLLLSSAPIVTPASIFILVFSLLL